MLTIVNRYISNVSLFSWTCEIGHFSNNSGTHITLCLCARRAVFKASSGHSK